jgi:integrase
MRGHVRQRGATWTVVVDVGRNPKSGKRKQKWEGGFRTKRDAEDRLGVLLGKLQRGERIDPDLTPLAEYVESWIGGREGLAPLSVTQYRSVLRNHIRPTVLGRTPIGRIRRADVRSFDRGLREKGLSLGTRRVVRAVLGRALADAAADDLLDRSPCLGAFGRGESGGAPVKRYTFWTESELRDLLAAAEGDRLEALWRLLVTCGFRRGEVAGLTWLGFDATAGTLSVTQQAIPTRGGTSITAVKTKGSNRVVTVDQATVTTLKEHRERQRLERVLAGDSYEDQDLIFANELGRPINPQRLTEQFQRLRKKAGLREGRLHDLRHSHASHLLVNGAPVSTVSARLGHSSPVITLTVYSHVIPASDRAAVERFAGTLR